MRMSAKLQTHLSHTRFTIFWLLNPWGRTSINTVNTKDNINLYLHKKYKYIQQFIWFMAASPPELSVPAANNSSSHHTSTRTGPHPCPPQIHGTARSNGSALPWKSTEVQPAFPILLPYVRLHKVIFSVILLLSVTLHTTAWGMYVM